jgi:hypothetical protein
LGENFEVEVLLGEVDGRNDRLRGSGPGTNSAAVAAFRRMAAEDKAEHERIQALIADGGQFTWIAGHPSDSRVDGT